MEKNIMTGCPCCHSTSLAKISPKTSKVPEDFLYFKNFRSYKHQCLVFLKTNNISGRSRGGWGDLHLPPVYSNFWPMENTASHQLFNLLKCGKTKNQSKAITANQLLFWKNCIALRLAKCYNQKQLFDSNAKKAFGDRALPEVRRARLQQSPDSSAGFKGPFATGKNRVGTRGRK